jgi:hypothetical protein
MDKSRWAEIGDLIIQMSDNKKYTGVVCKLTYNEYNHAKVFVTWSNGTPPDYNNEYGYAQSNIHNLRRTFDVVKAYASR